MPFEAKKGDVLSVDAVGTVMRPMQPVARVYAEVARRHGYDVDPADVDERLLPAMRDDSDRNAADPEWRDYWRRVIFDSTGTDDESVFEELYNHYGRGVAWHVDPQARHVATRMRERGVKVAMISNFDRRLRPLAGALGISDWLDLVVVSGEEGIEKPDPAIFARTAERLGATTDRMLHVGDSKKRDVAGARAAGCDALWFGHDLRSFHELLTQFGL